MNLRREHFLSSLVAGFCVAACTVEPLPDRDEFMRIPREIRAGAADMVIERVAPNVSPAEVATAVQRMVADAPLCFAWPGVWLDGSERRRSVFLVRYDLMRRDWGAEAANTSAARMQEFVDMGYLVAREMGDGAVQYALTNEGFARLQGSPYGGERPSFCAPSQRRVVEVTNIEPGQFTCGSLRVRFTHVADDWPSWARTPSLRERAAQAWAPIGHVESGTVTLGRQWFRQGQTPPGRVNGELRSLCYDATRQRVTGDDLTLAADAQ
ncbi:MAG: hypothetical protein AB7O98_17535 [Hyphomonadaceae bacterium]